VHFVQVSPQTMEEDKGSYTNEDISDDSEDLDNDDMKPEEIEDAENLSGHKGYKNGLPYFHRELSAQDLELIGDISPKPLTKTTEDNNPTSGEGITRQTSSSAWNGAQTWEERDYTEWAKKRFKELLVPLSVDAGNDITVEVTDLGSITGDAHVAVVRGKPRFIWDFAITLSFTATMGNEEVKGELVFPEVGYDADGAYEVEVNYKNQRPSNSKHTILKNILTKNELYQAFWELVGMFKQEFHEK